MHNKKHILIVTGADSTLGCGHMQRMASLAMELIKTPGITLSIKCNKEYLPYELLQYRTDMVPETVNLIIRDMRDSEETEIGHLKKQAPILVLDDCGEGRKIADFSMDLLPNLEYNNDFNNNTFLYGYTFTNSICRLGRQKYIPSIDVAIYAGADATEEEIAYYCSSIPEDSSCVILIKNKGYNVENRCISHQIDLTYSEILLSSKVLITHFGITMYEGLLCQSRVVVINPSNYHDKLTKMISHRENVVNAGLKGSLAPQKIEEIVKRELKKGSNAEICAKNLCENILVKHTRFTDYIISLL